MKWKWGRSVVLAYFIEEAVLGMAQILHWVTPKVPAEMEYHGKNP